MMNAEQIKLSDFLAAFYPDEQEEIRCRAFKPKGALSNPGNCPLIFGITRARLVTDKLLQSDLKQANSTRGIYFVVNSGGDADEKIVRFNAWFAECDDRPIAEQHQIFEALHIKSLLHKKYLVCTKSRLYNLRMNEDRITPLSDLFWNLIEFALRILIIG